MARDRDVKIEILNGVEHEQAWDDFMAKANVGKMYQCRWWADPLAVYGIRSHIIAVTRNSRIIGGGLFRSVPVPYLRIAVTQCLEGPIFEEWESEWADAFVAALNEVARRVNSMSVSIEGCPRIDVHRDLQNAFRRAGIAISLSAGVHKAVLSLEGRTLEEIRKRFNKGTKHAINRGQRNMQVRALSSDEELHSAYETWMATAKRKGFTDVRPESALRPVLRHCVDGGFGEVIAGCHEDRIVSSVFVSYVGETASYVYGGFLDGAEEHYPNHVLQYEAVKRCIEKGLKAYDFGHLTGNFAVKRSGVDQFKLGFGAVPIETSGTISWKRRPVLNICADYLRRGRKGKLITGILKKKILNSD